MGHILFRVIRWVLRNVFSLILILAVLLIGNWLHTQWDQAETAKQAAEQLRAERPNIGVQLLKASQELELQLRQSAATDAGLQKLQESVASSIKAKTVERDKLKTDHPVAINIPATPEFLRVTVLDMELSMLEQARTQTQVLTSLLIDITANKEQVEELQRKKREAEVKVYENKHEKWKILNDDSVLDRTAARAAALIPGNKIYDRVRALDAALPALQETVKDTQTLIASQTLALKLLENKLDKTRRAFLTGHESAEKALAAVDTKIGLLTKDASSDLKRQFWLAGGILLVIILTPIGIKLFFYYLVAPWAARQQPIRVMPNAGNQTQSVTMQSSGVSLPIILKNDEELVLHSDYLQSSGIDSRKETQWVLDWRYLFTSLAAGMYALTRIRIAQSEPVVVSSSKDATMELALIDIQDGSAIVFHPHYLIGVIQKRDTPMCIESRWRLWHLHSWLTLQLRYLVFHGPAKLIVRGCRGVRLEPTGKGRLINQAATLGFTANTLYSVTRCETFVAYLRGEQELFNDWFTGETGAYIYEETPSRAGKSGISGRGLEGFTDAVMKVFGV